MWTENEDFEQCEKGYSHRLWVHSLFLVHGDPIHEHVALTLLDVAENMSKNYY